MTIDESFRMYLLEKAKANLENWIAEYIYYLYGESLNEFSEALSDRCKEKVILCYNIISV